MTFSLPSELTEWIESEDGSLINSDVECYIARYKPKLLSPATIKEKATYLFLAYPEFRSLFDYRAKKSRAGQKWMGVEPSLRRANDLYIHVESIGPRCFIQHGHSTWIISTGIGADFHVNHNVTIGFNKGGCPKIGSNVAVRTGAVVVGPITIGNHVMVGANAVVSSDVPDYSDVHPPRSSIRPSRRRPPAPA